MRILLVDDSSSSRAVLRAILQGSGYLDIVEADSARMALSLLRSDAEDSPPLEYDIALMDLRMPDLDGLQATRIIKSVQHLQDLPVIIVTAEDDMESLEESFRAGAVDYLRKPVHPAELRARVRACLRLKEEMENRRARERELLEMAGRLRSANAKLKELAIRDELTGLTNRRHFMHLAANEWGRSVRYNRPMSLAIMDADHFKSINDTFGHFAGDQALIFLADHCKQQLREHDVMGRIGGEEFAILLPETPLDEACRVAERLRESVEQTPIRELPAAKNGGGSLLGKDHFLTVSIGVATMEGEETPLEKLLQQADKSLYEAKHSGRNCIRGCDVAHPTPLPPSRFT